MFEGSPPQRGDAGSPPDLLPGPGRHEGALGRGGGRVEDLALGADAVGGEAVVGS